MSKGSKEVKTEIPVEKRFEHVCSSIVITSYAVLDLFNLLQNFTKSKEANTISKNHTFNLFRASLSYMIVNEYCKIFEENSKYHKLSSIYTLLAEIKKSGKSDWNDYLISLEVDEFITENIRHVRDKSFAHSDDDDTVNIPFKIIILNKDQLRDINSNLAKLNQLIDRISLADEYKTGYKPEYKLTFNLESTSQTTNFINFSASTSRYFLDNCLDAAERGY